MKLQSVVEKNGEVEKVYVGDLKVVCEPGLGSRVVHVREIYVHSDRYGQLTVNALHDSTADVYGDNEFAIDISMQIGYDVGWSEAGMQQDGIASLE
jgi:hypothetical protein